MHQEPNTPDFARSGKISHWVGRAWIRIFGWEVTGEIPKGGKFVLIGAHHTSNWDLPFGLAAVYTFRLKVSWMGKSSLFKWPLCYFMGALGGIPIDRENPSGVVGQIVEQFQNRDQLVIGLAPSGTRSKRTHWRSGFYWLAVKAQVPILCGYLDYGKKRLHIGGCLMPSGDIKQDMDIIRAFYKDVEAKHPNSVTPILLKDED